jgi:hypothetical protein
MIHQMPKLALDAMFRIQPKGNVETLANIVTYVVEVMSEVDVVGDIAKAIAIAMSVASQRILHALPVDLSTLLELVEYCLDKIGPVPKI